MTPKVEFHFDFGSPNAYLAHLVIPEIERRTGAKFEYVPVLLGGVYKLTGNRSPAESLVGVKNKPDYERLETARFIERHGITRFRQNPFFPVNTLTIMRGAIAAQRLGVFERYVDEIYRHMWSEPKKLDDPAVLRDALLESGFDAERIAELVQDPEVKARLLENTERSVARGTFGSPTFFVGDEIFFGKDRLRDVEEAIIGTASPESRQSRPLSGGSNIDVILKRFEQPDEVRTFEKGKFEIIRIGGMTIGRATYEPGWKWSLHVGPATGASSCAVEHVGIVVSGRATAAMDNGTINEMRPGDVFHIAPGHDRDRSNERSSTRAHRARDRRARCRAVHEGHADFPAMRFFQRRGAGAEPSGRQVQGYRRAQRPGAPPGDQGVLRLANGSAALCQRRVRRRLRHRPRNVRNRRARSVADDPRRKDGDRSDLIIRETPALAEPDAAATSIV